MKKDVVYLTSTTTLSEAAKLFLEEGISGAPVCREGGVPIGVLTATDLVRYLASTEPTEPEVEEKEVYSPDLLEEESPYFTYAYKKHLEQLGMIEDAATVSVEEIMTPKVFELEADTLVEQAAAYMARADVHRVFVTEQGKLVGVVSSMDILRAVGEGRI